MVEQITEKEKVHKTRVAEIWRGEDGIVRNVFLPQAEVTLPDAIEINKANIEVGGGNKIVCLIDARKVKSSDREVREFGSRPETIEQLTASAILVGSPLSKTIGMLFIKLSPPPYPSRLFTSETEALEWLKGFQA